MPNNLNALIRYKEIDICLKNKYIDCTIQKLMGACTEALGEKRGIYKMVSERTIREDIRVMRSDILGFNAPIEVNNGNYYYTDENYSIFNIPITQEKLLREVLDILTKEDIAARDSEIQKLRKKIALVLGEDSGRDVKIIENSLLLSEPITLNKTEEESINKEKESPKKQREMSYRISNYSDDDPFYIPKYNRKSMPSQSKDRPKTSEISWSDIFSAI